MKTKIILVGIALIGLVAGCGLFSSNSDTFDPHIDGKWDFHFVITLPEHKNQFLHSNFLAINYPYIQACSEKQSAVYSDSTYWKLKENLKIAHMHGKFYKIEKINNTPVKDKKLIYKIIKDTSGEISLGVGPKETLNNAFGGWFYKEDPIASGYSKCRNNAVLVDTLFSY